MVGGPFKGQLGKLHYLSSHPPGGKQGGEKNFDELLGGRKNFDE